MWSYKQLNKGLLDSTSNHKNISDNNLLRIADAFISSKKNQANQPKAYQVGGMWEQILIKRHAKLSADLHDKNIDGVREVLSNFARNQVSKGLSLVADGVPNTMLRKLMYLNSFNNSYYN